MGCLQSKDVEESTPAPLNDPPPKQVDPRLPFDNYRQQFNLKNSWKAVSRQLEATAVDNLIRFFEKHPEHRAAHKSVADVEAEETMRSSEKFEEEAMEVFGVFDEVMESIELVDVALNALDRAGRRHAKTEGFQPGYYKDMEETFMDSIKAVLGDRFTEPTELNFRRLYTFCSTHMLEAYTSVAGTEPNRI